MREPYERQKGESKVSYEAFTIYRNLGMSRSLREVSRTLGKHRSLIEKWSRENGWVERVEAFDDEMDRRAILENEQLRKEMFQEHAQISRKIIAKVKIAVDSLNPKNLTANEIAKLFETAVKIERLSRGESTDVSQIKHSGEMIEDAKEESIFERVEKYAEVYEELANKR